MTALIVIAKAPLPGRVKTRLCPPCSPRRAAALAEAALRDTLAAVGRAAVARRVVALDGDAGAWLPAGFEVVSQRGVGLAERLAAAFEDVGGPALLVGMDTPQLTADLLDRCVRALSGNESVLGPSPDGGYWAIGLRRADARAFDGVPMSDIRTGAAQRRRLEQIGLAPAILPALRDVDTIGDARAVAALAPATNFAAVLRDTTAIETAA